MSSFSHTTIDVDDIRKGLSDTLSVTPGLENFKDSSNMKILTDVISSMVDINNYNIERRAEEAYPGTSVLDDSAIGRAHLLGYSVRLPKPAQSHVNITIKGGVFTNGDTFGSGKSISFKKWFRFVFNDTPFVFKSAYTINLTEDEFNALKNTSNVVTFTRSRLNEAVNDNPTGYIDIVQGEFKEVNFDSSTKKSYFQTYEISDATFSNSFGYGDPNYTEAYVRDYKADCYENLFTFVGKDAGSGDPKGNPFYIERMTLSRPDLTETGNLYPKVCLVRARRNGGAEILFGGAEQSLDEEYSFSGGFSERGNGKILVKYFSTLGARANRSDTIGKTLDMIDDVFIDNTTRRINDFITITFNRSVYNGSDRESKDSINVNAPASNSSKGRLVTKKDYETYLRGLTIDGKRVYGATAWSENEEVRARGVRAIRELANRSLFSVVSSLYESDDKGDWNIVSDISEAVVETREEYNTAKSYLDSDGDWVVPMFASSFVSSYYTDLYFKTKEIESVKVWTEDMDDRSMLTVVNRYVSPVIHRLKLVGDVYIGTADSIPMVSKNVKNAVYSYLDSRSGFKSKIELSNLNTIIEGNPSVKYIRELGFVGAAGVVPANAIITDSQISSMTGFNGPYPSTDDEWIRLMGDLIGVFGKLPDGTFTPGDAEGRELRDLMFVFYFGSRYSGITLNMVADLWKWLFLGEKSLYVLLNTKSHMTFREFNEYVNYVITSKVLPRFKSLGQEPYELLTFDLFTLYGNLLSWVEPNLSSNLVDAGGVEEYTVGNEVVQVEIALRYVYG